MKVAAKISAGESNPIAGTDVIRRLNAREQERMYRISVDVGGTFTDVVVADDKGRLTLGKALTTPDRSFDGFFAGLKHAAGQIDVGVEDILKASDVVIYGTTRATNAIVTSKTAKTAFLTTEGFPDTLIYKKGGKRKPFQVDVVFPKPYIPRNLTYEIPERIGSEGQVIVPLDEDKTRATLEILKGRDVEAVAVGLLWSVANPAHENRIGELIEEAMPGVSYTLSSRLNPVVREYTRVSAACIDASLKPLMQSHLQDFGKDLSQSGFAGQLLISASSGGVLHVEEVVERPIFIVKSGPAMAPLAGRAYSSVEDLGGNVIVVDTGGTTFDVSLIRDNEVKYSRDSWLVQEFNGYNLGMSSVDIRSIGSGGGSIAWIDSGGLLQVGPQSAGSKPGPACYGRSGEEATVTDAAVVLGYIDPERFLGGRMTLDAGAARRVVGQIAERLGKSLEETAAGIMTIANEEMIKAITEITVHDGLNPAESIIVAGGGAAGLNIAPIARALGCEKVLLPKTAGALSACGAQFSDVVSEYARGAYAQSTKFDFDAVSEALNGINGQMDAFADEMRAHGVKDFRREYFLEARYLNQQWETEFRLPVDPPIANAADVEKIADAFHETHDRLYGAHDKASPIEFVNWKGRLTAMLSKPEPLIADALDKQTPLASRHSQASFGAQGAVETPVYLGAELKPGNVLPGPAIIEEPTTTVVVYPGSTATVTAGQNYLLTIDLEQ